MSRKRQKKVTLKFGDQTVAYFLDRELKGSDSLQIGWPGLEDDGPTTRTHISFFVENGTVNILAADETRPMHSSDRHRVIARIPLEAIISVFTQDAEALGQELGNLVLKNAAWARPEALKDCEFIINIPLMREAFEQFRRIQEGNVSCDMIGAVENIRLITGDKLPETDTNFGLLVVREPGSNDWVVPWFTPGVSKEGLVVLCRTTVFKDLARIIAGRLDSLASYFAHEEGDDKDSTDDCDMLNSYPFRWTSSEIQELREASRTRR